MSGSAFARLDLWVGGYAEHGCACSGCVQTWAYVSVRRVRLLYMYMLCTCGSFRQSAGRAQHREYCFLITCEREREKIVMYIYLSFYSRTQATYMESCPQRTRRPIAPIRRSDPGSIPGSIRVAETRGRTVSCERQGIFCKCEQ